MLRMSEMVFDDVVQGTTPVYTDPKWNERLAQPDAVALLLVASQSSGTSPTVTVDGETSSDGVNWFAFGSSSIISALALSSTDKTSGESAGYMSNGGKLVRLKITLGGTTPSTRLQIWWTGRDFAIP